MRNIVLAAIIISLAGLGAGGSHARADQPYRWVPLGFCSLSSLATATPISACTLTNTLGGVAATWSAVGPAATYAHICALNQSVNYRDDGVAPTATSGTGGQAISAGACMDYYSSVQNIQFIQQSAGAVLSISLYK